MCKVPEVAGILETREKSVWLEPEQGRAWSEMRLERWSNLAVKTLKSGFGSFSWG